MTDSEAVPELSARHRKELKALQGQQRAAVKKCKTTGKGKKAKELLQAVEAEYDTKTKELETRHHAELAAVAPGGGDNSSASANGDGANETAPSEQQLDPAEAAEKKRDQQRRAKAAAKRERAREKERQQEIAAQQETAAAGPPPRSVENAAIQSKLPARLEMKAVAADGHCMYRAVAAQVGKDYTEIRAMAADTLQQHETDFAPFIVFTDDIPDFETHVARVRSSAEWGGHPELRAISMALNRAIVVYSARTVKPLVICEEKQVGSADHHEHPVRLSYHLQYYALGEHYNQVVEKY